MTVKIGMGGSALDLKDAKVWGHQANKIMVGTGTSAVVAWPTYPLTGEWSGTMPLMGGTEAAMTWATHTITEAGTYVISHTVTAASNHLISLYVDGDYPSQFTETGIGVVTNTATATFPAGTLLNFITYGLIAEPATGTWTIRPQGILVTPPQPHYYNAEPWYILPTVEGVTYNVSGTPGPGSSVTITATREEGYDLVGQTVWTHEWDPQRWTYTTVGNHTITIPEWATYVDIVCIGGGGSGGNGGSAVARAGEGGKAGTYGTARVQVQNLTSRQLTAVVGGGGTNGSGAAGRGSGGSLSRVIYTGTSTQVGNTGQGGASGRGALGDGALAAGRSATSISYNDISYLGGSGGANVNNGVGRVGTAPGGGGGGGAGGIFGSYWNGGNGGAGRVWITAYV